MNRIIYVDVDDTLVRSVGTKRMPMPSVIAHVRHLKASGHILHVWSSGGADYARDSAGAPGIAECFTGFLPKPNVIIDDQPVHEWRDCRHIYPLQAGG